MEEAYILSKVFVTNNETSENEREGRRARDMVLRELAWIAYVCETKTQLVSSIHCMEKQAVAIRAFECLIIYQNSEATVVSLIYHALSAYSGSICHMRIRNSGDSN